jgi:hypothetical protein
MYGEGFRAQMAVDRERVSVEGHRKPLRDNDLESVSREYVLERLPHHLLETLAGHVAVNAAEIILRIRVD